MAAVLRILLLSVLVLNMATFVPAQQRVVIPHHQDKPPGPALSPQEAVAKMTVPEGFKVEIVAAEPDIVNPIAMTIDEKGRFWITESLEYPRNAPGPGRDRVKVLEDTDGDGKADKFTVFLDGLNIPSGVAVGFGGVWIANSPDILFVPDADRDAVPDGPAQVVVTGFGRRDTHELPNSLTWGPDGWLYGLNGIFNPAHVRYPKNSPWLKHIEELQKAQASGGREPTGRSDPKQRRQADASRSPAAVPPTEFRFDAAMFRIHPRTREFQVFARGVSNPWGIAFNEDGEAFISACVIDHLWHITETGYYRRQAGAYPPFTWPIESIVDYKHQKAAYCGIHYFDSDAYPEKYRRRLYMGNIHGNCINVDRLERNGSTYKGHKEPDFLSANDAWFMPVVQKTGPDGSLYILDWYDRYHCYQDARRDPKGIDRLKGRLYRVRYKDTPRKWGIDLGDESDDALVKLLGAPNDYQRTTAQRLLQERATEAVRQRLLTVLDWDAKTPCIQRRHAFFALIGIHGCLDDLQAFEKDFGEDPQFADWTTEAWFVRWATESPAIRRLERESRPDSRLPWIATTNPDPPEVRLQQAIAIAKIPDAPEHIVEGLLWHLMQGRDDPLIPQIIWGHLHPLIEDHADDLVSHLSEESYLAGLIRAGLLPRLVDRILGRRKLDFAPVSALFVLVANPPIRNASGGREPTTANRRDGDQPEKQTSTHENLVCLGRTTDVARTPRISGERDQFLQVSEKERREATSVILRAVAERVQTRQITGKQLDQLKELMGPALRAMAASFGQTPDADDRALFHDVVLLLTSLKDEEGLKHARIMFRSDDMPPKTRLATLKALVAAGDLGVLAQVSDVFAHPKATGAAFRADVLAALGPLNDERVAGTVISNFGKLEPELQPRAVELLTQRPVWAKALLAAVGKKTVPFNALNLNQVRRLNATGDAELKALVKKHWGTIRSGRDPKRTQLVAEMKQFIRSHPGDPVKGIPVFKKVCAQCHKMYGEGAEVGPDITRNGRNSFDQLLSNVFDPSLVIGAAYQARTIVTTEGRSLTGLPVEESEQRVILKVQGGKLETIPRGEIEIFKVSELSMMPEQLEKQLKPDELANLFAYLTLDRPPTDPNARQLAGVRVVERRDSTDPKEFAAIIQHIAPGFTTDACGELGVGLIPNHFGRLAVRTHPLNQRTPCILHGEFEIPADRKSTLRVKVSHDPRGDWLLIVKVNGEPQRSGRAVGKETTTDGWATHLVDLSNFAGKKVKIELLNQPTGWSWEFAYWGGVEIRSE